MSVKPRRCPDQRRFLRLSVRLLNYQLLNYQLLNYQRLNYQLLNFQLGCLAQKHALLGKRLYSSLVIAQPVGQD